MSIIIGSNEHKLVQLEHPCSRALSEAQEKAQWLTGPEMPEAVLQSLLQGSACGENVVLINLTPYDSCVERVCLSYHLKSSYRFRTLSISTEAAPLECSQRLVAMLLMEDQLFGYGGEFVGLFSSGDGPLKCKHPF